VFRAFFSVYAMYPKPIISTVRGSKYFFMRLSIPMMCIVSNSPEAKDIVFTLGVYLP
jgi:hypothetical protein